MIKTLLTTLALLICTAAFAQNFILIKKVNGTARYKIYEGEILRFKHKDSNHMQREELITITDTSVITEFSEVLISDIKIIQYQNNKFLPFFLRSLGRSLIFAGPGLWASNAIYTAVAGIAGTWGRAAVSGGMLTAAGLFIQGVLKLTTERRIRIDEDWEIVPYNFNDIFITK